MADESPFLLRLSGAASWVRCAANPMMNKRPEALQLEALGDTTVRDEGTAMHWAAQTLASGIDAVVVGTVAPNGIAIDDELLDGALYYLDVLREYDVPKWEIEQQLSAPSIHRQCGGTPDAYGLNYARKHVYEADLKGGYVNVEVFPNGQLIGYSSAIFDKYPEIDDNWKITFVIIQPRSYHRDGPVREYTTTFGMLREHWNALRGAAERAVSANAPATAGDQCTNCNARHVCSVALEASANMCELSGEPEIVALTDAALDYELLRLQAAERLIKARLTGLTSYAAHMIKRGASLPHFVMERGSGRLHWVEGKEKEAIALGDMFGKNLRKDEKAITPLQASKIIDPALVAAYSERKPGEVKLTRFDANKVAKAFSNLKVE